jgi:hypothetical protein
LSYILAEQLWPAACVPQHHSSSHTNALLACGKPKLPKPVWLPCFSLLTAAYA